MPGPLLPTPARTITGFPTSAMINYRDELNPAQYEAATALEGPVLVIAGAGSGKTRTIVYRLARLVESGVPASSILLLTFTRKAAQEMLDRARILLQERGMPDLHEPGLHGSGMSLSGDPAPAGQGGSPNAFAHGVGLSAVQGGTFHSYAYSVLRIFQPQGYGRNLTVMDSHDILAALQHCREDLKAGKGDRSFPKNQTIQGMLSKSRNKEISLEDVLRRDASHLLPHADAIAEMGAAYAEYKREKGLLDYDDLLFRLEEVLVENPEALAWCRNRHKYIMVDEYQDTNPVQARIAALVAGLSPASAAAARESGITSLREPVFDGGKPGNIMVVGDDAQSIYAFRGADVRNILRFPELFPGARLIRLEENYRSTQPVLDLTNAVLEHAAEGFSKHLYTRREGSMKPSIVRPLSDRSEASLVSSRIVELLRVYKPGDVAVLFRAGFHSYALELQLNKLGVRFRKYGGIRYAEAAHIKDAVSFLRLVLNPLDFTAFTRMAELTKGVGAKTCLKLYQIAVSGDSAALAKAAAKHADLAKDLAFVDALRREELSPTALLARVVDAYTPRLQTTYPDDYPRRMQGLEQLVQIASFYSDLDLFVADLSLDEPSYEEEERDSVVLSTIHSSKGLEWSAVLVIDLVEERFPSRHALTRPDDYEEERRLMYVACTRAREVLDLYVPATMYDRGSGGSIPTVPSPFVRELSPSLYTEWQEGYTGAVVEKTRAAGAGKGSGSAFPGRSTPQNPFASGSPADYAARAATALGRCGAGRPARAFRGDPDFSDAPDADVPEIDVSAAEDQASHDGDTGFSGATPRPIPRDPATLGFCRHRVFGRGKIVQHLPPDKYRVNFPGVGLKVIMAAYLSLEE